MTTIAEATTRNQPTEHGNVIEITRYLISQYRIEYNADRIVCLIRRVIVEGPNTGDVIDDIETTGMVSRAKDIAEKEKRVVLNLSRILDRAQEFVDD